MSGHLLLIDVSGFAHRAYHAMPKRARKDGLEVHAILGTMSMIWKMLGRVEADPITYGAAVFDAPGKNFRYELYPTYKAGRVRQPELMEQLRLLPEAVRTLGLEPIGCQGWEADDVIATVSARAKAEGIRTTIVGIDKDLYQLIEDDVVELVDPVNRVRVLSADVEKKFGVPPRLMPDLQALSGDSVDGIPGVKGVGYKKASRFLTDVQGLKAFFANVDKGVWAPTFMSNAVRKARDDVALYFHLVTLRRDVPISVDFETLKPREVKRLHLVEMLRVLEAEDQFQNLFGGDSRLLRPVPKAKDDPLAWWRSELAKPGQSIPSDPQAGFYKRRLVKGGPEVACRIWREPELDMNNHATGNEILKCEVAGELTDPVSAWGYLAGNPISEADYRHMMELAKWARDHAPQDPLAEPKEPVDWNKTPPPF